MKNVIPHIITVCLLIFVQPSLTGQMAASPGTEPTSTEMSNTNQIEEAKKLETRLLEIKDMDKTGMNSDQKRALKEEVKTIKKQLQLNNGGVYLSVGAIIIIILLLILIL